MLRWRGITEFEDWAQTKDCSWWYGERASVSQLAGAAWMAHRGWAFEEYHWRRKLKGRWKRARIDLCVEMPGLRFISEAKQIWPWLTSRESTITGRIDSAFKGLKREMRSIEIEAPGDYQHIPLVFIAPTMKTDPADDPAEFRRLAQRFGEILKSLPDTASVWTFPEWGQSLRFPDRGGGIYYPGAALVARIF